MNAFTDAAWKTARADALETEAEALEAAVLRLLAVVPMLDSIEKRAVLQTEAVLERARDQRRDSAALLRQAA